jgi:phospholipid/cholesterol/gamma-HCH transport system permease protein
MLTTELQANTLTLRLSGRWTVQRLAQIEQALKALQWNGVKQVQLDATALEQADLSAMWLLRSTLSRAEHDGVQLEYAGAQPEHFAFLTELQEQSEVQQAAQIDERPWPRKVLAGFGKHAVHLVQHGLGHLDHFGRIVYNNVRSVRHPGNLRAPSVIRHAYEAGIQALPIVAMIAFFVAVIIAYIGASQLRGFGAGIYTVDLITVGVLRELGVLLTAIIVAGRSGSAFAAEIGVMKLNDEVDALKSIGLDPVAVLVVPRVLGLIIALPLLTVVADAMGMAGGALLSNWLLGISVPQFLARVQDALAPSTFWVGLIKAPVFALLIGMIGTYRGMQVRGSSRELGRLTTAAVVESIFMVIFANAVFAVIFVELDV